MPFLSERVNLSKDVKERLKKRQADLLEATGTKHSLNSVIAYALLNSPVTVENTGSVKRPVGRPRTSEPKKPEVTLTNDEISKFERCVKCQYALVDGDKLFLKENGLFTPEVRACVDCWRAGYVPPSVATS